MKTKKVLALVVLAAFLISIVPFAAFAAVDPDSPSINTYSSVVKAPTDSVEAQNVASGSAAAVDGIDGAEFTVVLSQPQSPGLVETENLFIASSRSTVDFLSLDIGDDKWENFSFVDGVATIPLNHAKIDVGTGTYSKSLDFKVVSSVAGTSNIVFGNDLSAVTTYVKGQDFATDKDISMIIQQKKFPVEFTSAKADLLEVSSTSDGTKPANGVDTYKVRGYVYAGSIPVSGKDVTFSITKGSGATLTATKATTDVTGKAEVKIYATKAGDYSVQAKTSGITTIAAHTTIVKFASPGVVSIKAESDNNQKVARDNGDFKLKFSAYDANGNRVSLKDSIVLNTLDLSKSVVTKPSGSGLSDSDSSTNFEITPNDDGYGRIVIDTDALKKDGDYEVKIYLPNGSTVAYKFNAKEQGDVVKMELSYGADNYAAESTLPEPEIKYYDAEGYKVTKDFSDTSDVKLSISDASFLDGPIDPNTGEFTLKEDKSGVITMTAVDTVKNLVATQVINVQKAASYLKLTPQSVGAVGGDVTVNIELVDVDGKLAATGKEANDSSATIIAKPEGAIASADDVDDDDFDEGKASVKVSSNMEGDVTLQVIIIERNADASDGKVYTGACTVSFGKAPVGGGQLIFIIGSPSFVAGNQVHAAESPSFIDNGRTFLGVRDMGTAIGATVEWDQASQTATLSKDGVVIKVTVGASKIAVTKSGVTSEIEIDAAAQNKNGRVYLPFRAVLEAFNYTVTYDQATNSIVCAL